MKQFIDKWFPNSLQLAYELEEDLHKCVETYSDKSSSDKEVYLYALQYLDEKLLKDLNCKDFIESDRLKKAYPYLSGITNQEFWSKWLANLKQVREEVWSRVLNGP